MEKFPASVHPNLFIYSTSSLNLLYITKPTIPVPLGVLEGMLYLLEEILLILNINLCLPALVQLSIFSRLDAFIWDSSRLEYEAAKDCDLITAGELFGRSGLGVGLEKKSPWTHEISMAILTLHESKIL